MGDEFGGIGSTIVTLIVIITIGSASTIWLMGFLSRRAAERRRRQFAGEEPLPSLFEQASHWASGEDTSVQEPPSPPPADDYPHMYPEPEPEPPEPDLDFLTRSKGLPTPDIDEIIRDVPKGYSEGQPEPQPDISEAREGEVISQAHTERTIQIDDTSDDDWEAAPEPVQSAPASSPMAATTRVEYEPHSNELPEDAIEVLRVYRDLSDGKLIFHMKDRVFASMQEIKSSPLTGRFSAIVEEMVTVEGSQRRLPAPPPPPPPPARPTPPPPPPRQRESQPRKAASGPEDDAPEPTIADQIQGFLQQRLGLHPEFSGRSIHIRPSIDGGVSIEVDSQYYEAVADIPDDQVRAFLQKTIQDWSDHH